MADAIGYILGYLAVFAFGAVIGSFLNVCIYRMPEKQSIAPASHCMACGYQLRWYDNIPLLSYMILRGRCRNCHTHLSLQYPLVEGLNAVLYLVVFLANGWNLMSVVYCILTSALIVLTVIDWRTYRIPDSINLVILVLGIFATLLDYPHRWDHLIGCVSVGTLFWLIYFLSAGRAIGGGDAKLMNAAGLLLGWKRIIVAYILGCILAAVIHLVRMKISKQGHRLSFGPYLATGIWISIFVGEQIFDWYLRISGIAG